MNLLVVAKAPQAGRSKTRLCPPCTPANAAAVAEAALADTLEVVAATGARPVLALSGPPGAWLPAGFRVLPQRGGGLDERLANAWEDAGGGGVQIGMDTPQVTSALLDWALSALDVPGTGAVLGPAVDGGWWAIGLQRPDRRCFIGVPMSTPSTGAAQRRRLAGLGLRVTDLPVMRDVDCFDDAEAVARAAPRTRFAAAVAAAAAAARSAARR